MTNTVVAAAAIAILLGALHVAAPIVTPVLLAVVATLVLWPVYLWLREHRLGALPSLILLLVGLIVGGGAVALVIAYSAGGLASRLQLYSDDLSARIQTLQAWLVERGFAGTGTDALFSGDAIGALFQWLIGAIASALSQGVVVLLLVAFLMVEGAALANRFQRSIDDGARTTQRIATFAGNVGRYFLLRAAVNAVTGLGVTLVLWLLGVDFPLLWGVLTFFLSFIPYIGMFLASVPSVLLAWAEYDLAHALVTIVALTVVNAVAENILQPALMHKGLDLSPTFVFVSVLFWGWLLGGSGAFLAIPISLAIIAALDNLPAANWFVRTVTTSSEEKA